MAGRLTQSDPPWLAAQLERAKAPFVFFSSSAFRPPIPIELLLLYPRGAWDQGIRYHGYVSPEQPQGELMTPEAAWSRFGEALGYERRQFFDTAEPMLKEGKRPDIWIVPLVEFREHRSISPTAIGLNPTASQMTKALDNQQVATFLQLVAGQSNGGAVIVPEPTRRFRIANVADRLGQPAFRAALVDEFSARCCMTECALEETLQAAHIIPYVQEPTFLPEAGLLLRADIHNLFDLHLVAIREDGEITCAARIQSHKKALGLRDNARLPASPWAARRQQNLERHARELRR